MFDILAMSYLGGWIVATLVVYAVARRLADRQSPSPHPLVVSVVAGALWPLLVIGLAELSSVMVYAKVSAKPEPEFGIFV